MSLPTFKFTSLGAPTNNESVNSGLSSASKMEKSGIISTIRNKAQDTFKDIKMPDISLDLTSKGSDDIDTTDSSSGGFFSLATLIKVILAAVIIWFMWSSLSTNGDFHLGMGDISSFFKSMEEKGREFISRFTNNGVSPSNRSGNNDTGNDESSDSDSDSDIETEEDPYNAQKAKEYSASSSAPSSAPSSASSSAPSSYHPPVPPPASNSSDKHPGFVNDDTKYTFLDKADRSYTGPAPRADDSTSVTQKHQTGKGGYCYIGEDRGFRSCVQVEPSDKCMSGQVFSRHDICVNPTLRE